MPRSFRNGDIPIVFGTNDPNISNEDFLENLETEIAIQINGKLRGNISYKKTAKTNTVTYNFWW